MMSYITLHPHLWKEHSYVACCGTSILPVQKMLERMPRVDTVFLCLDNDSAGSKASERFASELSARGVETERLLPEKKDWNEDLAAQSQAREVTRSCQTMCCP
jgi:DNA primase